MLELTRDYKNSLDLDYLSATNKLKGRKIVFDSYVVKKYCSNLKEGKFSDNHKQILLYLLDNPVENRYVMDSLIGSRYDYYSEMEKAGFNMYVRDFIIRYSLQDSLDWILGCLFELDPQYVCTYIENSGYDYFEVSRALLTQSEFLMKDLKLNAIAGMCPKLDLFLKYIGDENVLVDFFGNKVEGLDGLRVEPEALLVLKLSLYLIRFVRAATSMMIGECFKKVKGCLGDQAVIVSEGMCEVVFYSNRRKTPPPVFLKCLDLEVKVVSSCWSRGAYIVSEGVRSCYSRKLCMKEKNI